MDFLNHRQRSPVSFRRRSQDRELFKGDSIFLLEGSSLGDASKRGTPRKKLGLAETSRPKKKAKVRTRKMSKGSLTHERVAQGLSGVGVAPQGEDSAGTRGKRESRIIWR
ncbi:hypothetical protein C4D60_Mb04t12730 [Musa balbisiana]|uniref:Uncharacterized protein n=1 Tax=Musa balbisiana TaxID=52838 RepID=A0A4S8KBL4_MUSBA|nr:hypothetical protein C4D60_Mb04t12730 [Musa balbisiana]